MSNDLRRGRHVVHELNVHLVFLTVYRKKVFTSEALEQLEAIFADVCTKLESNLVEFSGGGDYVHLLVSHPPKVSVSSLVNSLKGVSSRLLRKNMSPEDFERVYSKSLWSPSYYADSNLLVGNERAKRYIMKQTAVL